MHNIVSDRPPALVRLLTGHPVIGLMQTVPCTARTAAILAAGYDFLILDREHGRIDEVAHAEAVRQVAVSPAFAAVRVEPGGFGPAARYAGFGAHAVLLADTRGPQDARKLVSALQGTGALALAMVESGEAVTVIDTILEVPGLAGIIVGPNDLAQDLGHARNFAAPAYRRALECVEQAVARAGQLLGSRAHGELTLPDLLARGHRFLLAGGDQPLFEEALRAQLTTCRALLGPAVEGTTA